MALSTDKHVFTLVLDDDSLSRLRGIYEMYDGNTDEMVIARLINESKQHSVLDHFWIKKII